MEAIKILLLVIFSTSLTQAQLCGIPGVPNGTTVFVNPLKETLGTNIVIWSTPTFNMQSADFINDMWNSYLGERVYVPDRYDMMTSDTFSTLVQKERVLTFTRKIGLYCAIQGPKVEHTLIFTIDDENTETPKFPQELYKVTVSLSDGDDGVIDAGIFVYDEDVDLKNARVVIRSSNPDVFLKVTPLFQAGVIPSDYYNYKVDLIVNKFYFTEGHYPIILTATDGLHATRAYLDLIFVK